ncbi:MAG: hypothetical protein NVS9B4_17960 [Candidatus Acidiferrum sp.]
MAIRSGNVFQRFLVLGFISIAPIWANAQEPDAAPKPAARSGLPGIDLDADQPTSPDEFRPDNGPLTGIQTPTVGQQDLRHSYWVPGLQYGNTAQSSGYGGSSGWTDTNYLAGNLTLLQAWSRSQLSLNYSGGGYISTDSVEGSGQFHQLGFVQSFELARWQLQFLDQFSYLPETAYGFGTGTSLGLPGIGGSLGFGTAGLETGPNQSIFNALGPRYSNTFATQATYALSRRSSITMAGSYGLLRFIRSGNVDSDQASGNLGYNYALSPVDTIGINYRLTTFHFTGFPQSIGNHVANFVYGRRITGRLGLKLAAGPEITTFRVPVAGMTRRVSGSGEASLIYAVPSGDISLTFSHGVSGGSGVLIGARTDQLTADVDRRISRLWRAHANLGYARNSALFGVPGSQNYNSWFAGGGLGRPLGKNANLTFGYNVHIQSYSQTRTTLHLVTMSLQWHTNPFVIR